MFAKQFFKTTMTLGVTLGLFAACGGATGSSTSETTTELNSTSSAIAAVFTSSTADSSESASYSKTPAFLSAVLNAFASSAQAEANDTCTSHAPDGINFDYDGLDGTYGSASNSVTLTQADYCVDAGTALSNTGTGPDGDGLFASFQFRPETVAVATCTNANGSDQITMTGQGVYRNTLDFTEVYGAWTVTTSSGEEHQVDCTMILNHDETIFDASCSDEGGNSISLDADTSCTIEVNTTA